MPSPVVPPVVAFQVGWLAPEVPAAVTFSNIQVAVEDLLIQRIGVIGLPDGDVEIHHAAAAAAHGRAAAGFHAEENPVKGASRRVGIVEFGDGRTGGIGGGAAFRPGVDVVDGERSRTDVHLIQRRIAARIAAYIKVAGRVG